MNKEKTALTQLIENIDARLANDPSDALMYALETVKIEAKSLLQKEQEQIEQAFDDGSQLEWSNYHEASQYYEVKYGGENVD